MTGFAERPVAFPIAACPAQMKRCRHTHSTELIGFEERPVTFSIAAFRGRHRRIGEAGVISIITLVALARPAGGTATETAGLFVASDETSGASRGLHASTQRFGSSAVSGLLPSVAASGAASVLDSRAALPYNDDREDRDDEELGVPIHRAIENNLVDSDRSSAGGLGSRTGLDAVNSLLIEAKGVAEQLPHRRSKRRVTFEALRAKRSLAKNLDAQARLHAELASGLDDRKGFQRKLRADAIRVVNETASQGLVDLLVSISENVHSLSVTAHEAKLRKNIELLKLEAVTLRRRLRRAEIDEHLVWRGDLRKASVQGEVHRSSGARAASALLLRLASLAVVPAASLAASPINC